MNAGDFDAPDGAADLHATLRPRALQAAPALLEPVGPPPLDEARTDDATRPWARLRRLVVHNLLHLDDTPHRIALGVALGIFVAFTPTLGLQMLIYVAIAAVVGANKVSGILPIWLTNPLTAVPIYYANWRIGRFLMTGSTEDSASGRRAIEAVVENEDQTRFLEGVFTADFWRAALDTLVAFGAELWVGSVVVGGLLGAAAYWVSLRAVVAFRRRRGSHPA